MAPPCPIAVVGMGCRFADDIDRPSKLWELIAEGRQAWSPVPQERWNDAAFHHPHADMHGMTNHRGGHFVKRDLSAFDAGFFEIGAQECHAMDPQQRLLLETSYEALENAGLPLDKIKGTNTGVYAAAFSHDYEHMTHKDDLTFAKYYANGLGSAFFSNRLSFFYDFHGPSLSVDTACSGSLVALHLAVESLRSGETDMGMVAGSNLMLEPDMMEGMSLLHITNRDGRSYSFDSRGDGYGRGEGVATIVVKRLEDAIAAGDPVHAIIRGTGVNSDGYTRAGISVPNSSAQEALMRSLYNKVELDPRDTVYFEAHGTGTAVGDAAEVNAIARVFRPESTLHQAEPTNASLPLYLGSVKANIGHTEACAGLAGLIKAILVLQHEAIPPVPDLRTIKDGMVPSKSNIQIPISCASWPRVTSRRASVNSFGYGGTNSHAILENYYPRTASSIGTGASQDDASPETHQDHMVIPFTANSTKSLQTMIEQLLTWMETSTKTMAPTDEVELLADLVYTLSERRTMMPWRYAVVSSAKSLQTVISALTTALTSESLSSLSRTIGHGSFVTYVFTGQGAQWHAMGRELLRTSTTFRASIIKSAKFFSDFGAQWCLLKELDCGAGTTRVNDSEIGQPSSTAIQIALVDLLASFGIEPSAVVGHSSGEIAAAYSARAISHEDAVKLSYTRGFLSGRARAANTMAGGMLAVGLGKQRVDEYLGEIKRGRLVVACLNSLSSVTVSGDEPAIEELEEMLRNNNVFARRLKVDTAYHSHHMESVAQSYLDDIHRLGGIKARPPVTGVKFISTVTGQPKDDGFDANYWVQNLVSPVKFSEALSKARHSEVEAKGVARPPSHVFLEVGPHHALEGPTRMIVADEMPEVEALCLPTLVRGQDAVQSLLESAAALFQTGVTLKLDNANCLGARQSNRQPEVLKDLPPYPWDLSKTYWHESHISKSHRLRQHPYHELLGVRDFAAPLEEPCWRHIVSLETLPWLRDHEVDGAVVFPATGYMAMAIEAKKQVTVDRQGPKTSSHPSRYVLKDLSFVKSLVVPESPASVELRISLRSAYPKGTTKEKSLGYWEEFTAHSLDENGKWRAHCSGKISIDFAEEHQEEGTNQYNEDTQEKLAEEEEQLRRLKKVTTGAEPSLDCKAMYKDLSEKGNRYEESFALIRRYQIDEETQSCTGDVETLDIAQLMPHPFMQPFTVHPTTLDALTHTSLPLFRRISNATSCMTVGVGEVRVSAHISTVPGTILEFVNTARLTSRTSAETELAVFQRDPSTGARTLVVEATRGQLQAISSAETDLQGVSEHVARGKTLHSHEWLLDIDLTPADKGFEFQDLGPSQEALPPGEHDNVLNQATALYISGAFNGLDRAKIQSSQRSYFDTLDRFFQSTHVAELLKEIQKDDQGYYDLTSAGSSAILQQAAGLGAEGEAVTRVGSNLRGILTGQVDAHSLLFADDVLTQVYAAESYQRCYEHMIHFLHTLGRKNPSLRVIELGAGTGGATAALFSGLDRINSRAGYDHGQTVPFELYDFTDISRGFFQTIESGPLAPWTKGARDAILKCRLFDVNAALEKQAEKYERGDYDVVIASNALHVGRNLNQSLDTVKALLKPGGWLMLVETTNSNPYVNLLFGVFSGWYEGVDDNRTGCPTLSTDAWNTRLVEAGFNGTAYVAHDYDNPGQKSSFLASQSVPSSHAKLPQITVVLTQVEPEVSCSPAHVAFARDFRARLRQRYTEHISVNIREMREIKSAHSDGTLFIVLDDMARPLLGRPTKPVAFNQIKALVTTADKILWANIAHDAAAVGNPETALIAGLLRSAREEHNEKEIVLFGMQTPPLLNNPIDVVERLVDVCHAAFLCEPAYRRRHNDNEWAYSHGQLLVPRLLVNETVDNILRFIVVDPEPHVGPFHQTKRPLKLDIVSPGVLETIRFVDDDAASPAELEADMVEVKTAAFGLNPKDMIIIMGQNKRAGLSHTGEVAGTITAVGSKWKDTLKAGDRVCAWASTSQYASRMRVPGLQVCRIPNDMSLSEAATIPVAWGTAWKALVGIAKMQPGQSLLIHAAAGAVGQAVIEVARKVLGVTEIYATCSSPKRALLTDQMGIPDNRIFSSRSASFKRAVLRATEGRGVDVVINSLKGDLLRESMDCVAQFGTFVEIGKDDILSKALVSLAPLERGITISAFDLTELAVLRPQEVHGMVSEIVKHFEDPDHATRLSHIEPLASYDLSHLDEAVKVMRTGRHTGKLVLTADESTQVAQLPCPIPCANLSEDGVHIIAGGAGGIGRLIGRWMLERGAKQVALLSRRDASLETKDELERESQQFGAHIQVVRCDVSSEAEVATLAAKYRQLGVPVRGLVHSAAVLQDVELADMTVHEFEGAIGPKVDGTRYALQHFDTPDLDYIVLLSSAAGILGPRGAANYAAANAYMDTLSQTYHTERAHLVVLNLGPVKEAGIVERDKRLYDVFMKQGFVHVTNKEIHRLLDYSCGPAAQKDDCKQIITSLSRDAFEVSNPEALNRPLLKLLPSAKSRALGTGEDQGSRTDAALSIRDMLSTTSQPDQAVEMVTPAMIAKIAAITGVDAASLEDDTPLESIGMDSLIVVDLKNWIQRQFGVTMQPSEIMEALGVSTLAQMLVNKSPFTSKGGPTAGKDTEARASGDAGSKSRTSAQGRDSSDQNETQSQTYSVTDLGVELSSYSPAKSNHALLLDQMLDEFLRSAGCVSTSKEELAETERRTRAVKKAAAGGQLTQLRALEQRSCALEESGHNWITHFSLGLPFMEVRTPLVPFHNVFAVHPMREGAVPTATERAATLALAACRCLETVIQEGSDTLIQMGGLAIPRLFSSVRLPGSATDHVARHPLEKFFVVLYRGDAFRAAIPTDATWDQLHALLVDVVDFDTDATESNAASIPALTMASRPIWAEMRDRLTRIDECNSDYLDAVDSAAFILCIDEEEFSPPLNPHDLSAKVFWGDGKNRWQDKSLQLVACSNGLSGHVCEHSLGDDRSFEPLAKLLAQGIFQEEEALVLQSRRRRGKVGGDYAKRATRLPVRTDSVVMEKIQRALEDLSQITAGCVVQVCNLTTLEKNAKWSVDLVQLVVHLAGLRFFGSHFSSVESVQGFHRAPNSRAIYADTTLPEVWDLCDAIVSGASPSSSSSSQHGPDETPSRLLPEALRALRNRRADKLGTGISWNWYLPALQRAAIEQQQEVPGEKAGSGELDQLLEDPLYRRCRVPHVRANKFRTSAIVSGSWPETRGTVRTRYDFEDDGSVEFHLFGNDIDIDALWLEIQVAAQDIESLL